MLKLCCSSLLIGYRKNSDCEQFQVFQIKLKLAVLFITFFPKKEKNSLLLITVVSYHSFVLFYKKK